MLHRMLKFLLCILFLPSLWATNDQYYVLYRGVHFPRSLNLLPKPRGEICQRQNQDCVAIYNQSRNAWDTHQAHLMPGKADALAHLRSEVYSSPEYGSAYHWLVASYVGRSEKHEEDMGNPFSPVRVLLNLAAQKYGDPHIFNDCNNNLFVSTTLRPEIALRFAAGEYSSRGQGTVQPYADGGPVGYLEVFHVPQGVTRQWGMHLMERYAHGRLPMRTGYHSHLGREEVIFPFIIPGQYHWMRLPVYAAGFIQKPSRCPEFPWDWDDREGPFLQHLEGWAQQMAQGEDSEKRCKFAQFQSHIHSILEQRGVRRSYGTHISGEPMPFGKPTQRIANAEEDRRQIIEGEAEPESIPARAYAAQRSGRAFDSRTGDAPRLYRYDDQDAPRFANHAGGTAAGDPFNQPQHDPSQRS